MGSLFGAETQWSAGIWLTAGALAIVGVVLRYFFIAGSQA